VGKGAIGGRIVVLKARNQEGRFVDGSVGKSLGYGAQGGLFLVQGNCDSRACIRLSGADVVIGGRITGPVDDGVGHLGLHANLKGFAFEYMTNGRAVVLGDPGPWICAGMTGGSVYLMPQPEFGFDVAAIRRRIAKGAKVVLSRLLPVDAEAVNRLLGEYEGELSHSGQPEEAAWVREIRLSDLRERFVRIIPESQQTEQDISTE
jgi:glutamate synthase (NADPH/NADH) large chain